MASSSDVSSSATSSVTSATTPKTCALFNSSTPNAAIKLDRSNYLLWAAAITPLLRGHELESHVDGTGTAPPKMIAGFLDRRSHTSRDEECIIPFIFPSTERRKNIVTEASEEGEGNGSLGNGSIPRNASPNSPTGASTSHNNSKASLSRDPLNESHVQFVPIQNLESSQPITSQYESAQHSNLSPVATDNNQDLSLAQSCDNRHHMVTRSKAGITKPKHPFVGLIQAKYALDILKRFDMTTCAPVSTPMAVGRPFTASDGELMKDPSLFRQAIGSLQYLVTTRPDIAFSVNKLSQFLAHPTEYKVYLRA
ncbi:putative copia-type protein [Senna tora]|uniref:Putative copia-type protein n=1 Tax=Senna tora TaxID=362788 RepID=A0A834XA01_9FABA|nr:putative copia-type protein [Senna tora]